MLIKKTIPLVAFIKNVLKKHYLSLRLPGAVDPVTLVNMLQCHVVIVFMRSVQSLQRVTQYYGEWSISRLSSPSNAFLHATVQLQSCEFSCELVL